MFFETKNIDVEQKHNLKSGKSKDKKGIGKKKQDRKPKERENISGKQKIAIENVHVVLFMKQSKEERKMKKRQKQETKRKQKERQEGRKKDKRKRETEKEKQKKGEAKKG